MGSPDFSGYATRNDLYCSDGRVIRKNAFKGDDGCTVPLIWNHDHKNQEAVLGHAILENRDDGVYAYGYFNDTEAGQHAKKLVQNGDVKALSIWANQLKQNGSDVVHGVIRELSLVLEAQIRVLTWILLWRTALMMKTAIRSLLHGMSRSILFILAWKAKRKETEK